MGGMEPALLMDVAVMWAVGSAPSRERWVELEATALFGFRLSTLAKAEGEDGGARRAWAEIVTDIAAVIGVYGGAGFDYSPGTSRGIQ